MPITLGQLGRNPHPRPRRHMSICRRTLSASAESEGGGSASGSSPQGLGASVALFARFRHSSRLVGIDQCLEEGGVGRLHRRQWHRCFSSPASSAISRSVSAGCSLSAPDRSRTFASLSAAWSRISAISRISSARRIAQPERRAGGLALPDRRKPRGRLTANGLRSAEAGSFALGCSRQPASGGSARTSRPRAWGGSW
jgi:hypothetical protein